MNPRTHADFTRTRTRAPVHLLHPGTTDGYVFSATVCRMGAEAKCTLTVGRTKAEGKALLETEALIFRGGDTRLSIPYKDMSSVDARDGVLRVTHAGGSARFAIGAAAAKWADKIRKPPSRADKLGIKAGHRVLIVGVQDRELETEVESRGAQVVPRQGKDLDLVFYAAEDRTALALLGALQRNLKTNGAIWVVRPKGSPKITEADVMKAGKSAGLVDVKVVRFSETHTAEKFVIPVKDRG
jgi:hypothetical protein